MNNFRILLESENIETNSNNSDFVIKDGVLTHYKGKNRNVVIPDGVKQIGCEAFGTSFALKESSDIISVIIPNSVEFIGWKSFIRCDYLESVTLGNGVTQIDDAAFYECRRLTNINIPDSMKRIGDYAFKHTNLKELTIPSSITYIGNNTFENCYSLTDIYFKGTIEKWNSIKGWSEGYNEHIPFEEKYTVHCTDGDFVYKEENRPKNNTTSYKVNQKAKTYEFWWCDCQATRDRTEYGDTYYNEKFKLNSNLDALLLAWSIQEEWGNADIDNIEEVRQELTEDNDGQPITEQYMLDLLSDSDAGSGIGIVYGIKLGNKFIYNADFDYWEEEREKEESSDDY